MMNLNSSLLFLISFLQLSNSANVIQPLSALSLNSIVPDIALGKIDLTTLRGLYIDNLERGIDLLSAFLTKHFLDYNPNKFREELAALHNFGILSCILSKELSDTEAMGGQNSLFDQLYTAGLFTSMARSRDHIISMIRDKIALILEKNFTFERPELINNFVFQLIGLKGFNRMEELGPLLLRIIKLEEFDESLGNEIIMSNDNFIEEVKKWAQILGFPFEDSDSFSLNPSGFMRKIVVTQNEASKEFSFHSSEGLQG